MKPVIVGQAPGPRSDPGMPLEGRCEAKLCQMAGIEPADFRSIFEVVNLLDRFPGKCGKGDLFPVDAARKAAMSMLVRGRLEGRPVVLLGLGVAAAFMIPGPDVFLRWRPRLAIEVAVCPHPSGVSRWWNDPANVRSAKRFWRRLAGR